MGVEVEELLRDLVAIDSQNPGVGEARIADYVDAFAREAGFDSRIIETAPGRCNVLITVDAGGPRCLALSGHLDTKPVGDSLDEWETPPLELHVEDGLAYGLGTSDMKGAVAAMLFAARQWSETAESGRLALVFTADEEAGSEYGAKALCERGLISADGMIIGEPCGISEPWEAIFLISRGICCFDVLIEGVQGHSGLSERLPTSATVAAAGAVLALHHLEPTFDPHPEYDYHPTVNAAVRLEGGVFYGVHPGYASVGCDIRLVPGMTREQLDQEIHDALEKALPDDVSWRVVYRQDSLGWMEPSYIDPSHDLVSAARQACQDTLGRVPRCTAYPGGTDATAFTQMANVPTIASLGPGWLSVAHGPNEHVGLEQLDQARRLYQTVAHLFLQRP